MASYSIRWKRSAEKELRGLHRHAIPGVLAGVEALAKTRFPTDAPRVRIEVAYPWQIYGGLEA